VLYHKPWCPYCMRVFDVVRELGVRLEMRSTVCGEGRRALIEGGGRSMVPCLRIEQADGSAHWLYESRHIAEYLRRRFGAAA